METTDSWVIGEDEADEEDVDDAEGERLAQREGRRRLAGQAGREKLFLEVTLDSLLFCGEIKRFIKPCSKTLPLPPVIFTAQNFHCQNIYATTLPIVIYFVKTQENKSSRQENISFSQKVIVLFRGPVLLDQSDCIKPDCAASSDRPDEVFPAIWKH